MRLLRCVTLGLAALPLASCAWTVRENRPVWNAFEQNLVPGSDGAFYAALPLTVPVGLCAIVVDTFVAHPLQVVDDAWQDTCDVWHHIDFEEQYYTESALIPLRTVATPLWFVGSFLGRSMFDWPTPEQWEERQAAAEGRRRAMTLQWLELVAGGAESVDWHRIDVELDDELRSAVEQALAHGGPSGRMAVYKAVARCDDPGFIDWDRALQDPSAVVRYRVLDDLPRQIEVSAEVRGQLLADPDQAVRERARLRFAR